jgi:hypothetical protein
MGPLTPIIGLRLLALAAGLRHNAEIGQPGLCFSAYGHKFGINHLGPRLVGLDGGAAGAELLRLAARVFELGACVGVDELAGLDPLEAVTL